MSAKKQEAGEQAVDILLVENEETDIKITQKAFERARLKNRVFVVRDGLEALDFLHHRGDYKNRSAYPVPDLILLDINMPKMGGFEFLNQIKGEEALKSIPVIMLTSSKNEKDIAKSYSQGASSYIQKPITYGDFVKVIENFNFYWQLVVKLPRRDKD